MEQRVTFLTVQDEMVETEECFVNPTAFLAQAVFQFQLFSSIVLSYIIFWFQTKNILSVKCLSLKMGKQLEKKGSKTMCLVKTEALGGKFWTHT